MKRNRRNIPREEKLAQQATEAVIGSILLNPSCFLELDLVPEDFEKEYQRMIYDSICGMVQRKESIDVLTLSQVLEKYVPPETTELPEGCSTWLSALTAIQRDTPTAANVGSYAKIVRERSLAKKAAKIGHNLNEMVTSDIGAIDTALKDLLGLRQHDRKYSMRLGDAASKFVDDLDDLCEGRKVIGIPTGFHKLDGLLGGFAPGHLIVVGARPGMGKTTFGLQVLLHNSKIPSGFMSAEMPTDQLLGRAVAVTSGVSSHAMRLGKIKADEDWAKISQAVSEINVLPIYVNDKPSPTADEVLRQARHWKHEHDIKLLCIDYIQRIKSIDPRRDRREELSSATQAFKEIGRELKIPVILLAQINREVEKRADKRPTLADFKETGALEEEADVVITLFRNELYEPKNVDTKGIIELAIAKNRHGPVGWFKARYNGACLRIENIDPTADAF